MVLEFGGEEYNDNEYFKWCIPSTRPIFFHFLLSLSLSLSRLLSQSVKTTKTEDGGGSPSVDSMEYSD